MPTLYDNFSQVRQYIDENNTSYVSKTELANASYVTSSQLSDCSYATTSYVVDYVAEHGGGGSTVIDENIIPKEDNTYTLGDSTYLYSVTYSYQVNVGDNSKIYNDNGGISFSINNNNGIRIGSNTIYPRTNKYYNLGSTSNYWSSTYTKTLYTEDNGTLTNIDDKFPTYAYVTDYVATYGGGSIDLSSYVTKTELSNCGYITSIPSEYITQTELSANSYLTSIPSEYITDSELSACGYATTSQLNNYLPLNGGTLTGNLVLGNTYFLTVGTQRAWKLFEDGSGGGAYIALQAGVDGKNFYIRDMAGNNLVQIYESSINTAKSAITNYTVNTYTNNIIPLSDNTYTLGSHSLTRYFQSAYTHRIYLGNQIRIVDDGNNSSTFAIYQGGVGHYSFEPASFHPYGTTYTGVISLGTSSRQWGSTYTKNLFLDGTDINNTLSSINSVGKIHYGTAVHNRTTYTTTCTVDTFDTDSNGNPLPGTMIAVKLTSITGTNPATLYPVKFIVNGKENLRWYSTAGQSSFGNGRNWYRDMNDGTNRYWYWFWDGTYWVWQGISDERDTTYYAMSDAEASAGTSTIARLIKPVTLATYYTSKSAVNGMFSYDSTTGTLTITTIS